MRQCPTNLHDKVRQENRSRRPPRRLSSIRLGPLQGLSQPRADGFQEKMKPLGAGPAAVERKFTTRFPSRHIQVACFDPLDDISLSPFVSRGFPGKCAVWAAAMRLDLSG